MRIFSDLDEMKAVVLISGGIDSPVAAQIAIQNGFQPLLLHYHNYPFHSLGTLEKVVKLSNRLASNNPKVKLSLAIMSHGQTQETILNALDGREIKQTCLFCRIQMFSKAQEFAYQSGAEVVVTGEIMGEQASQTLDNLSIVTSKTSVIALRPLIGYNKEEVVNLSKKWGYYDFSILPGGCCNINPQYPETRGREEVVDPIYERIYGPLLEAVKSEIDKTLIFQLPVKIEEILQLVET
jgi:thiamine biosynthesis protein ThiI